MLKQVVSNEYRTGVVVPPLGQYPQCGTNNVIFRDWRRHLMILLRCSWGEKLLRIGNIP
jgi:hypothetical protein